MFMQPADITPRRVSAILAGAEAAARAIPPAFPLDATVAVNPFLGQTAEDLATASARLARVAGVNTTQARSEYANAIRTGRIQEADLAAALDASPTHGKPVSVTALRQFALAPVGDSSEKPLPTVAELAAEATGTDWPSIIEKSIGLWAAGHFDRGQALWSPKTDAGAFAGWRAWAAHDLTPEIAGLEGFCTHVTEAPDTTQRAILRAAQALDVSDDAAQTVFHRLLLDLGGWSQHARWLLWQAELDGGTDWTLTDLLAVRLIWEEALLAHCPEIREKWAGIVAVHAKPLTPTFDQVVLAILQDAAERAYQRTLSLALDGIDEKAAHLPRPTLQAAFCIDVRSEVFRRALESLSSASRIQTIGFAGFFGLPVAHQAQGSDVIEARLPVLLQPAVASTSQTDEAGENRVRIAARARRAWGRFRQAAVSSFAFVESAGPLYVGKLIRDALGRDSGSRHSHQEPAPRLAGEWSPEAKVDTAAAVLKAMSLTSGFGRIVVLAGHGGHVTNNPHESAYHCGACGGHTGEISARLLATLLNDIQTREGLRQRGIDVPDDTRFVAALHDTTTDEFTLYDEDARAGASTPWEKDLQQARLWLDQAGVIARAERAAKLPGARPETVSARARNWAEVRPEWGLAGCAAFVAAPREATTGKSLGGRAFLHSYDWQTDEDFKTLELIITAPVVVASWISLQYYGSSVAPDIFGGGNKLIHNVVGGIGVIEGNSGRLRPGLPWQAVHDGERLVHEPLRLSVMIEAPREAIAAVLDQHPEVRALFDNGWLHLFALKDGQVDARYLPGLKWTRHAVEELAA